MLQEYEYNHIRIYIHWLKEYCIIAILIVLIVVTIIINIIVTAIIAFITIINSIICIDTYTSVTLAFTHDVCEVSVHQRRTE